MTLSMKRVRQHLALFLCSKVVVPMEEVVRMTLVLMEKALVQTVLEGIVVR